MPVLHHREEALCESQTNSGYSVDGAYAEYALADERFAVPVPDGVTSIDASPLACAGVTTFAAIKSAAVAPGDRVGVFGVGGFGHLAAQYARIWGRGGRLICVALPADGMMHIPIFDTVLGGLSVIGSIMGTRHDLTDVFDLHAAGRTQVLAETRKLEQINDCFAEVLAGQVSARLVLQF